MAGQEDSPYWQSQFYHNVCFARCNSRADTISTVARRLSYFDLEKPTKAHLPDPRFCTSQRGSTTDTPGGIVGPALFNLVSPNPAAALYLAM